MSLQASPGVRPSRGGIKRLHRRAKWWSGIALLISGCVYDGDNRCGDRQVFYANGLERCVCDATSVWTKTGCVPCGLNEVPGASGCVCKAGYGRAAAADACVACGINEVTGTTGACECAPGYARASAQAACALTSAAPGAACDAVASPCGGDTFKYCYAFAGTKGYCTTEGCTRVTDCPTGYACNLSGATSFCQKVGLGLACNSSSDCAGTEATYCDSTASRVCLIQGCNLTADNCPTGYECCDMSTSGLSQPLCVSIALGGCSK